MARNKYPEQTVQKILDVSYRLFLEKGYDHTTIQDIVDALGMSKGAVYHHFKSKEEILDRIGMRYYDDKNWFEAVRMRDDLNGLEKIREILRLQFVDSQKHEMDSITNSLHANPRMIAMVLDSTVRHAGPFLQQFVEEGVRDGSLCVEQPKEFSEAVMMLINMWVGMFTEGREDFINKTNFIAELGRRMGAPLLDDTLLQASLLYFDRVIAGEEPKETE